MSAWDEIGQVIAVVSGGAQRVERRIVNPKRGPDGLFVQPHDSSPERERDEQHNRDRFASHLKYADPFTGLSRTFDDAGDYNCGRCNQADGISCLLLKVRQIDREAGSCGDWENLCAGDPEMVLHLKSIEAAGYAIAENGVGWGCHRCPFASPAHQPDSRGRQLYCGKMDARVFWNACCNINGAKSLELDKQGMPKQQDPIPAAMLTRRLRP